jgi:release factor glutamine methyltransferase
MAETHALRTPDIISTGTLFADYNVAAEKLAKKCTPAVMPSLDHLRMADFEDVYEPSDDTFLLCDGLHHDLFEESSTTKPILETTLELGCGTGAATVFIANTLKSIAADGSEEHGAVPCRHFVTDINERAIEVALGTAAENGVELEEAIQCDLASKLLSRLAGQVDVLIFNPPYVVTPDDEVGSNGIEAAWAGGLHGRRVLDRALPQIARLLKWPHGAAYIITVDDNKPEQLATLLKDEYGIDMRPLVRRRARNEYLSVQKLTLTRQLLFED